MRKRENVKVKIPAGVEAGMILTMRGEGHAAQRGGVNGDLQVVIEEIESPDLKREGNNLFYTHIIPVTDAMLGCEISVPVIGGTEKVKLEPGTQSGTVVRLRGKGLPTVNSYGRGDLYVKVLVWIPRKLDRSEKAAIESMRGSRSFTPDPNREDKALFEKEKTIF